MKTRRHAAVWTGLLVAIGLSSCAETPNFDDEEMSRPASEEAHDSDLAQQAIPETPPLKFTKITANGPGCPTADNAKVTINPEGDAFMVVFDKFFLQATPDDVERDQDLECLLTLDVDTPVGLSYSIASVSYAGTVDIPKGVSAEHSVSYAFQGSPTRAGPFVTRWRDKTLDDYNYTHPVSELMRDWSFCASKRSLQVRTRISLTNAEKPTEGRISLVTIDGQVALKVGVDWKRCRP